MLAAQNGHTDIVNALLEKNADLNLQTPQGDTALIWAAQKGHIDCVKALLEAGATVDVTNEYGKTALMIAAVNGHASVSALIQAGADMTAEDNCGDTASAYATQQQQHQKIIDLLSTTAGEDVAQVMQEKLRLSVSSEEFRTSDRAQATDSKADESELSKDQGSEQKSTNQPGK